MGTDKIEKATMDGNSRTVLHSSGLRDVYGLTLDFENKTLYWADYTNNIIEASSTDGSNRRTIVSSLRDPWSIAFSEGVIYWTDVSDDSIYSYTIDGYSGNSSFGSIFQLSSSFGNNPYSLHVVKAKTQPPSNF